MRQVNIAASTGSWKGLLTDSKDPAIQQAAKMMLNIERANWHWLTDLSPNSRVLDLGAGSGAISHALGLRYRQVVAVEPVLERVEFMRQRFSQEKLSNVRVLRSSLWKLPFANNSFDLVAMNGVLEWVPQGVEGDPGELQVSALKKAFDLLRPGGYIYVGIENRMCPGYFIGYPDPHCGLPFVTILPRFAAQWYARKKGVSDGYRNYLYSSRGYRKLLQKSGFKQVEIYLALPSYNHPRFLIPIAGKAFEYYIQNFSSVPSGWLRKALRAVFMKLQILKYLEYSFVILARK